MRPRRYYGAGFLLVLVAAILGAFLARQAVGKVESPNLDGLASVQQGLEDLNIWALLPLPAVAPTTVTPVIEETATAGSSTATSTPQPIVVAPADQPDAAQPAIDAPEAADTPVSPEVAAGLPEAAPTATRLPATPTQPVDNGLSFVTAGPVRNSSGDCAGASIRGVIRDSAGVPLSAVRLWRYDQWGNEQVVESKSGDADRGQYDFPLGDTPNVHYVQVIDAAGVIISPVIEIAHRQGDAPDAICHWLDWVQR
ncbi:MAG: hypothetical protein KDH89_08880 [Anaerolineae bacterium]|nr:hypothetical protein [Anaerolineae bacterium]